jgi:hypothetical protein
MPHARRGDRRGRRGTPRRRAVGSYAAGPPRAGGVLARVYGVKASLAALAIALGSFVTPRAIDLLGIRGALIVLGLIAPTLAVLAWRRLRAIDEAIAHRDQEIGFLGFLGAGASLKSAVFGTRFSNLTPLLPASLKESGAVAPPPTSVVSVSPTA